MEPASTLITAALAAATIIPGYPAIEVWLTHWENRTQKQFEFCNILPTKRIVEKPPFKQLEPGNKNLDVKLDLHVNPAKFLDRIRVVSSCEDDPLNYLDFLFMYYHRGAAFQVSCVHSANINGANHLKTLLDEHMRWIANASPKYILIEIDGIIEQDLKNSSFKVEHEMFRFEKLK